MPTVPEGQKKLAGGVSHRNRTHSEPAPAGAADRRSNDVFRRPCRGAFVYVAIRWLTPADATG